jgi:DNA helicase-2/ATP-dependent DNA helicase PcrA
VVGPGARPYRRLLTFARLAEQLCAYAEDPSPDRILDVEREVFRIILNVTGQADFRVYTYDGRRAVIRLLWLARDLRQQHEGAIAWLQAAAGQCASVLCERGFLPTSSLDLFLQSVTDMRNDMVNNREDIENMLVADLGLFANPDDSIKLLTMHGAKGREFDAVALVDLHEGVLPHWRTQTSEALLAEQRRLLYVAVTRARRLLLCVTDDERSRPVSRFLSYEGLALVP